MIFELLLLRVRDNLQRCGVIPVPRNKPGAIAHLQGLKLLRFARYKADKLLALVVYLQHRAHGEKLPSKFYKVP